MDSLAVTLAQSSISSYLPIMVILTMAISFGVGNVLATKLIGPSRTGDVKGQAYESGMNPIGTARKRFNVRFFLIAMVFLVFDVEVIFLYPWADTFTDLGIRSDDAALWLGRILFFLLTTIVAYLYGFRKGVFRFD